jgi:hypothetical protein
VKIVCNSDNVLRQAHIRPLLPVFSRFAMSSEVYRHHAIVRGKDIDLIFPEMAIAGPAVKEDKRGRPISANVIHDPNPI